MQIFCLTCLDRRIDRGKGVGVVGEYSPNFEGGYSVVMLRPISGHYRKRIDQRDDLARMSKPWMASTVPTGTSVPQTYQVGDTVKVRDSADHRLAFDIPAKPRDVVAR